EHRADQGRVHRAGRRDRSRRGWHAPRPPRRGQVHQDRPHPGCDHRGRGRLLLLGGRRRHPGAEPDLHV
ncbi:MAG: hypothetical protein AVDCRST_MAG10-1334, partial [uncultured Acidimicrobiales bacterium]